ncbi:MAG: DUF4369 domain-containing protein [Flavobacteriaceae bacterium]|nr:DUF4369 domain-containing protein [Flavobacteriaceae bacterium]
MKNSQIYCSILCIWLFSCQNGSHPIGNVKKENYLKEYSLRISIDGVPSKSTAYLNILEAQQLKRIDNAPLINHQFHFKGHLKEPSFIWLTFDYTSQGIPFILEASNIHISSEVLHLKSALVKGGPLNKSYTDFKRKSSLFFSKIDVFYQRFQKARLENNSQELALIHKEISDIKAAYFQFCINYIHKHPDSFVSLIVLNDLIDEKVEKKKLFNAFSTCTDRLKKNAFAQIIQTRINEL